MAYIDDFDYNDFEDSNYDDYEYVDEFCSICGALICDECGECHCCEDTYIWNDF